MAKKVVKKRVITETTADDGSKKTTIKEHDPTVKQKKVSAPRKKRMTAAEREEMLIENFVGLQHAMTNLSIKFGTLSDNLADLLKVFEEAALNYARGGKTDNEDMIKKINSLLDQNKTIARGLVLMEGKLRGRPEQEETIPSPPRMSPPPMPSSSQSVQERPKPKPLPSI